MEYVLHRAKDFAVGLRFSDFETKKSCLGSQVTLNITEIDFLSIPQLSCSRCLFEGHRLLSSFGGKLQVLHYTLPLANARSGWIYTLFGVYVARSAPLSPAIYDI